MALLQRGGGGGKSVQVWFLEEYVQPNTYFLQKVFCFSQGAVISMKDFSAFLRYEVKQEPGS